MRVAFLTFVDAHDNCIHVQYTEKINCVETESYQIPGIMKAYMPEVLDYIVPACVSWNETYLDEPNLDFVEKGLNGFWGF